MITYGMLSGKVEGAALVALLGVAGGITSVPAIYKAVTVKVKAREIADS